jgi:L-ascorbate metabolism protein UlaG (beta-lactamase superfamily)
MNSDHPKSLAYLHWLGHDSFRIDEPIVIYLDPWKLPDGSPPADLILISHEHGDHCSPADVQKIRKGDTVVVAAPTAVSQLDAPVVSLQAGEQATVAGVTVEAIQAYNIGKPFHPKEAGHIGFILTLQGERLYFAGDTDKIPEMEGLACDIALLPVSGTYVMTAEEAAQAAEVIQPRVAVPMHYGAGVVGTVEDAERFQALCSMPVVIMEKESGR